MFFAQLQLWISPGLSNNSLPGLKERDLQEGQTPGMVISDCVDWEPGLYVELVSFSWNHCSTHLAFLTIPLNLVLHCGDGARGAAAR